MTVVLGVSGLVHDSAAAVIVDGVIVSAVQEERLTGIKGDPRFPAASVAACLEVAGLTGSDVDLVAYYEKPLDVASRSFRSFVDAGVRGWPGFRKAVRSIAGKNIWVGYDVDRCLRHMGALRSPEILFVPHHRSHASAFFASPFETAAILTIDGVGEQSSTEIARGVGPSITNLVETPFPHSLGFLYSAITQMCGFAVNTGEGSLMGLAPFGEPMYVDVLEEKVIDLRDDGSFTLDQKYFDVLAGRSMASKHLLALLDARLRHPDEPFTQQHCDLAASAQQVLERAVLSMARYASTTTGERHLVMGGGVALNCVAVSKLRDHGPFDEVWVSPAPGDAGSAAGAALWAWFEYLGNDRRCGADDAWNGALLGPSVTATSTEFLRIATAAHVDAPDGDPPDSEADGRAGAQMLSPESAVRAASTSPAASTALEAVRSVKDFGTSDELAQSVAVILAAGDPVGVAVGRLEFGPRALGARSILADPRRAEMKDRINLELKRRERFRPFGAAVLSDRVNEWFTSDVESPFMAHVATVRGCEAARPDASADTSASAIDSDSGRVDGLGDGHLDGDDPIGPRLNRIRSPIPAVTHVDGSCRYQTVRRDHDSFMSRVLVAFERLTGCPVLLNTSLNVRGQPLACTEIDAVMTAVQSNLSYLVVDRCLVTIGFGPTAQNQLNQKAQVGGNAGQRTTTR